MRSAPATIATVLISALVATLLAVQNIVPRISVAAQEFFMYRTYTVDGCETRYKVGLYGQEYFDSYTNEGAMCLQNGLLPGKCMAGSCSANICYEYNPDGTCKPTGRRHVCNHHTACTKEIINETPAIRGIGSAYCFAADLDACQYDPGPFPASDCKAPNGAPLAGEALRSAQWFWRKHFACSGVRSTFANVCVSTSEALLGSSCTFYDDAQQNADTKQRIREICLQEAGLSTSNYQFVFMACVAREVKKEFFIIDSANNCADQPVGTPGVTDNHCFNSMPTNMVNASGASEDATYFLDSVNGVAFICPNRVLPGNMTACSSSSSATTTSSSSSSTTPASSSMSSAGTSSASTSSSSFGPTTSSSSYSSPAASSAMTSASSPMYSSPATSSSSYSSFPGY